MPDPRDALITGIGLVSCLGEGPDAHWSLSVLKFVVDTSLRSFPSNVRELDERGLFNPEQRREDREHFEIEKLFQQAQADRSQRSLAAK